MHLPGNYDQLDENLYYLDGCANLKLDFYRVKEDGTVYV